MTSRERVTIVRLNWAGLGVAQELTPKLTPKLSLEPSKATKRGAEVSDLVSSSKRPPDRCVPLSRVGEALEVRWRLDGRDRVVGERLEAPQAGWEALGCDQAARCPGCTLRHLNAHEQGEAQLTSHTEAIERLAPGALSELQAPIKTHHVPRDRYRARLRAQLFRPSLSAEAVMKERAAQRRAPLNSARASLERLELESPWTLKALRGGMWARWGEPIDLTRCPVQSLESRALLTELLAWLSQRPNNHALLIEALTIQALPQGGEAPLMSLSEPPTGLALLHVKHQPLKALQERLSSALPSAELLSRCALFISMAPPSHDRRAPDRLIHLAGLTALTWRDREGLSWRVRPPAWLPQSPHSVSPLRELIWESLACRAGERVFELGCGVGVVSFWLARRGLKVWGADLEPEAVQCAQESAPLNRLPVLELELNGATTPYFEPYFKAQDGRRGLAEAHAQGERFEALILHAMRSPLTGALNLAAHLGIQKVCYVAPSAPSLARDIAEEPRYQLTRLSFLDQTPGSAHALSVATLQLKGAPHPSSD